MDKKVSKILRKMNNDSNKNIELVKSVSFSEEVIKAVIYSDYDVTKKLSFLYMLFGLNHNKASNYCTFKKHTSVGTISVFIKTEFLDNPKFYNYNIDTYKILVKFLKELIIHYYDFSYEYLKNSNTFDISHDITKNFLSNVSSKEMQSIRDEFLDFKRSLYIADFDKYFINKNIDKSVNDLKIEITNCFSGINDVIAFKGTLLNKCTEYNPLMPSYKKNKFLMTKKLLEVGVDPNILNKSGESFIFDLLFMIDGNNELLYEILDVSLKYGFDLNSETDLLRILFQKFDVTTDLLIFLFDNGLKTTMSQVNHIKYVEHLPNNEEQLNELSLFVMTIEQVDLLVGTLNNNSYKIEDEFDKKIFVNRNNFNYILNMVKSLMDNYSTKSFSDLWFETIVENRNNSINQISDEVTATEALEGLRKLALDTVKILNDNINNQQDKIMTYKK